MRRQSGGQASLSLRTPEDRFACAGLFCRVLAASILPSSTAASRHMSAASLALCCSRTIAKHPATGSSGLLRVSGLERVRLGLETITQVLNRSTKLKKKRERERPREREKERKISNALYIMARSPLKSYNPCKREADRCYLR